MVFEWKRGPTAAGSFTNEEKAEEAREAYPRALMTL